MEEKTEQPRRMFQYIAILYVVLFLIEEWIVTQCIASDCGYNEVLGGSLTIGTSHIYPPWDYFFWCRDEKLLAVIPKILDSYSNYRFIALLLGAVASYFLTKGFKVNTSHGSASFATKEDIDKSDLGEYVSKNGGNYSYETRIVKILGFTFHKKHKIIKKSGVVVGINPFTHKLMLHDGVEHMLLMAPTRSGKGVCTIVPTGLIWKHSIFFFDPKGELWSLTSGFRKKYLHQKVAKFQPLCTDGSGARWNPLAEINYRTFEELSDVTTIVSVMVRPDGEQKGGDSFWPDSAAALLNGVILHLLYMYDREKRPLPCPTDIMSFLSSPDKTTDQLFTGMKEYPHITVDEFLETPLRDADGNEIKDPRTGIVQRHKNPLKEIYGEYIKDFKPFTDALGVTVRSIDEIRTAIQWKLDHMPEHPTEKQKIKWTAKENGGVPTGQPFYMLLVHPKVAECAANMLNGAEQTRASIMQTAQTALAVYQDPVVQENTAVSDFAIRDLLDPRFEFSLYLVMEVKDVQTIKPIARLFIQMLCSKLIRDMKFDTDPKAKKQKKQRLLLMLDEFPQLGNMKCIELALAICAGYGIKMCIVCQDVNQLNKAYTKDNSIGSNCHVHIYFTPNIDSGGATAEAISKTLGKKTIETTSHSSGKGLFDGSNSTSSTGRELMTPDEVSHMSSEKELVFVAGHKAIFGDKLRYYEYPALLHRTQLGCPKTSDSATTVRSYSELFALHAADAQAKEETRISVLEEKAQKENMSYQDLAEKEEEDRKAHEQTIIAELEKKFQPAAKPATNQKDSEPQAGAEPPADDTRTTDPQEVAPKPADIDDCYRNSEAIRNMRKKRNSDRAKLINGNGVNFEKEEHELPEAPPKDPDKLNEYLNYAGPNDDEDDLTLDEE